MPDRTFHVIVIGGGHAGVEAAWAAANLLPEPGSVALVTQDPTKVGVMSCNPAIGGLAKGQLVREIDALGGLMGLAADATGIQFKVLNTSKGPAVHGPRAQCDKHAYAEAVQAMIAARPQITVIAGTVEELVVDAAGVRGVRIATAGGVESLAAGAVVLTTGTFMRGLMHTGEQKSQGGRHGEAPAVGISAALRDLGFELGRLKTGTPPRLRRGSIDWQSLDAQHGDTQPTPFSELSREAAALDAVSVDATLGGATPSIARFPVLEQIACRQTSTTAEAHALIRANLHRAPMFSGQIESVGPRYCPSIEDKCVRFAERLTHGVFLEPESLRDEWVYCNGIATSLPADVQDAVVRMMPGCEKAEILRYGYAVEYDMVRPHQIMATGETRRVAGLFLAGQINGTSGYEEAAAQGLIAGVNAARRVRGENELILRRDQAYIGVLMDDLVTKTPVEPYRMFTSRAEHRLLLRSDNAADRLTPLAIEIGLLADDGLGAARRRIFERRTAQLAGLGAVLDRTRRAGRSIAHDVRDPEWSVDEMRSAVIETGEAGAWLDAPPSVWMTAFADRRYAAYIERERADIRRRAELEDRPLPDDIDYAQLPTLRTEARQALARFRPRTFGQAGRLEGMTPADVTLLAVLVRRWREDQRAAAGS